MKKSRIALSGALKQEFQKDLELFKHFLLLINNSGPIRNVELMWNEEDEVLDPTKQKFKSRVGTEDAVVQIQPCQLPARASDQQPCLRAELTPPKLQLDPKGRHWWIHPSCRSWFRAVMI